MSDEIEMDAKIRIRNGRTVRMIGDPDAIDKITMQMRTHSNLLTACQIALTDYEMSKWPGCQHIIDTLEVAIEATGEAKDA